MYYYEHLDLPFSIETAITASSIYVCTGTVDSISLQLLFRYLILISIDSNSSNTPVFTDLTYQTPASINNSFSTPQAPVDVLTNVINQYMTTSSGVASKTQRRQMINRNQGQSLTSVEVLTKLEEKEKEKAKKQKTSASAKKTSIINVSKKRSVFFRSTESFSTKQLLLSR